MVTKQKKAPKKGFGVKFKNIKNMKILIVEDEPVIAGLFKVYLSQYEHQITHAESFRSGIKIMEETYFDLVAADYQLGDGTGIDIIISAKEKGIPCFLMSGGNMQDMADRLGVPFLAKPFNSRHLLIVMKKIFNTERASQSNAEEKTRS